MGPVSVASMTNKRFMISFTDDKTRISSVAFMAQKSEALEKFKDFQATVEGESGLKIGTLRTDRGGEYLGKEFKRYLRSQQIEHEETIANTPEQNGVSERLNRTLMEKAHPLRSHYLQWSQSTWLLVSQHRKQFGFVVWSRNWETRIRK